MSSNCDALVSDRRMKMRSSPEAPRGRRNRAVRAPVPSGRHIGCEVHDVNVASALAHGLQRTARYSKFVACSRIPRRRSPWTPNRSDDRNPCRPGRCNVRTPRAVQCRVDARGWGPARSPSDGATPWTRKRHCSKCRCLRIVFVHLGQSVCRVEKNSLHRQPLRQVDCRNRCCRSCNRNSSRTRAGMMSLQRR